MRRVLRLALALSVLVALSAPGAVRAQSRDEDPGVPQVTLEFEDDYEDTRATGHAAYDEMDAAQMRKKKEAPSTTFQDSPCGRGARAVREKKAAVEGSIIDLQRFP